MSLINLPPVKLNSKGSPAERIWVIAEAPLPKDKDKGFLFSSAMGWSYDKLMQEAGVSSYYTTYAGPELDADKKLIADINHYKPPFIVLLDTAGKIIFPEKIKSLAHTDLWAGSLLTSPLLTYPHYLMPTYGPETCIRDWTERQIVKSIDYGKLAEEFEWWRKNGWHKPLKHRKLDIELNFTQLIGLLQVWTLDLSVPYLSVDIETVYPREKSEYFGHPGYPVTVGIAISPIYGISFSLFQETQEQTMKLWRTLAKLLAKKKIIGQNFHSFDAWFFQMLGMPVDRLLISDTMHRHALLWPELSHKLQFLTRQYTRQPYYKSEGHGWSLKDLKGLKHYNALDVTVTYEVFEAQEAEFDERPHLR